VQHAMKTYGGVEVHLHAFLTSTLEGDEWWTWQPGHFTPGTHWIGGWEGSRVGLDVVTKKKVPAQTEIWLQSFL
jgi:hypothetical protein